MLDIDEVSHQCNHEFPCNHCTRRRQPELCSYGLAESRSSSTPGEQAADASNEQHCEASHSDNYLPEVMVRQQQQSQQQQQQQQARHWRQRDSPAEMSTPVAMVAKSKFTSKQRVASTADGDTSIATCLGYSKDGKFSLLSLMRDVYPELFH